MSYIDITGKTEEEAIALALEQLHLERDDVSVEVLERAKNGFLGIRSTPAKVRVTYGLEEEESTALTRSKEQSLSKQAPQVEPVDRMEAEEAQTQDLTEEAPEPRDSGKEGSKTPLEEVEDEKAQAIRTFLAGLMEKLEIEAKIQVFLPEKGRYLAVLTGPNMGQIIGRRGETLDAIQQLTSYSVNRSGGGRVRVMLDAENYRAKREESLNRLARKVAAKVVRYRRSVTLEPMNAYERHIIHAALQDDPNVTTGSIGTDPNRRVVVSYLP